MQPYEYIKINTDYSFDSQNKAAVIKCLLNEIEDASLFETWLKKESSENIEEKIKKIIKFRNEIKEIEDENDQNLCINILSHLIAAKYSGKSQSYDAIEYTLNKLIYCFKNKEKIIFTFCFGGYKNFSFPSYPEVDWAELWHLNFLISYLWPVINNYKYGVEFTIE